MLRRISALERILESREEVIKIYSKKLADYDIAMASIESEREMNSILTEEIDQIKNKILQICYDVILFTSSSCSCLTKTPEPEYHKDHCQYKKLMTIHKKLSDIHNGY